MPDLWLARNPKPNLLYILSKDELELDKTFGNGHWHSKTGRWCMQLFQYEIKPIRLKPGEGPVRVRVTMERLEDR